MISSTSSNIAATADLIAVAAAAIRGVAGIPFLGIFLAIAAAASIYATISSFRAKVKNLKRQGGRIDVNGRTHEQGGHLIEGTNIEVEKNEWVVNAKSSDKYDKTLETINKNNPHHALTMLIKESRIGLPETLIHYIKSPEFSRPAQAGFNDKQLKELTSIMREHLDVTKGVAKNTKPGKQYIGTPDDYLEIDGDNKSHKKK